MAHPLLLTITEVERSCTVAARIVNAANFPSIRLDVVCFSAGL